MFADVLSRPLGTSPDINTVSISSSPDQIPNILKQAHDNAGHMSLKYTLDFLRPTYSWPTMKQDADSFIKTCVTCNKTNAFRPKHSEILQKLEPSAVEMGDGIHLDLLDMPKSTMGHVAICKLVDAATGFIITNPVFNKTSKGVAHTIMEKYIPYFGCPKVLVTDKGKENVYSEISLLCQKFNIKHVTSSTAHPQSNGLVEPRQQMILNNNITLTPLAGGKVIHTHIDNCKIVPLQPNHLILNPMPVPPPFLLHFSKRFPLF